MHGGRRSWPHTATSCCSTTTTTTTQYHYYHYYYYYIQYTATMYAALLYRWSNNIWPPSYKPYHPLAACSRYKTQTGGVGGGGIQPNATITTVTARSSYAPARKLNSSEEQKVTCRQVYSYYYYCRHTSWYSVYRTTRKSQKRVDNILYSWVVY